MPVLVPNNPVWFCVEYGYSKARTRKRSGLFAVWNLSGIGLELVWNRFGIVRGNVGFLGPGITGP